MGKDQTILPTLINYIPPRILRSSAGLLEVPSNRGKKIEDADLLIMPQSYAIHYQDSKFFRFKKKVKNISFYPGLHYVVVLRYSPVCITLFCYFYLCDV